jgi:hypothetical protein
LDVGGSFAFGSDFDDGAKACPDNGDLGSYFLEAFDGVAGVDEGSGGAGNVFIVCYKGWWDFI